MFEQVPSVRDTTFLGVLLDNDGVASGAGARIYTDQASMNAELARQGELPDNMEDADEHQPRAAVVM